MWVDPRTGGGPGELWSVPVSPSSDPSQELLSRAEKRGDFPTPVGPRFLTVGVKGQDFDLVLWPGTPARGEADSAVYTIEVEDIQMAFETLRSRGVTFEPPEILEFPWGSVARFQDPDGNLLQVREGRGEFRR
jgi:predicted enzyme related to lactoylglutathione lyase